MTTNNFNQGPMGHQSNPSKGYKIIIVVLAAVVLVVSGLFLMNINDLKEANKVLNDEKQSLKKELTLTVDHLNNMRTDNEEINRSLNLERIKADSLLKALRKEKTVSHSKIKRYEKQVSAIRKVMKKYISQIDSLNTVNKELSNENIQYRTALRKTALRADAAEEQSNELAAKLRQGAQISARDIELLVSRKPNGKMTKAKKAKNMRIDFSLSANVLATPGEKTVFCRVITPDGYPLAETVSSVFSYEGEQLAYTASRDVDYQNQDIMISLYYDCYDLVSGEYTVELYMDSVIIGVNKIILN